MNGGASWVAGLGVLTQGHQASSTYSLSIQDSPINKLLYARDIPRYKRMVERYGEGPGVG